MKLMVALHTGSVTFIQRRALTMTENTPVASEGLLLFLVVVVVVVDGETV
jgi:hypothetical protein